MCARILKNTQGFSKLCIYFEKTYKNLKKLCKDISRMCKEVLKGDRIL